MQVFRYIERDASHFKNVISPSIQIAPLRTIGPNGNGFSQTISLACHSDINFNLAKVLEVVVPKAVLEEKKGASKMCELLKNATNVNINAILSQIARLTICMAVTEGGETAYADSFEIDVRFIPVAHVPKSAGSLYVTNNLLSSYRKLMLSLLVMVRSNSVNVVCPARGGRGAVRRNLGGAVQSVPTLVYVLIEDLQTLIGVLTGPGAGPNPYIIAKAEFRTWHETAVNMMLGFLGRLATLGIALADVHETIFYYSCFVAAYYRLPMINPDGAPVFSFLTSYGTDSDASTVDICVLLGVVLDYVAPDSSYFVRYDATAALIRLVKTREYDLIKYFPFEFANSHLLFKRLSFPVDKGYYHRVLADEASHGGFRLSPLSMVQHLMPSLGKDLYCSATDGGRGGTYNLSVQKLATPRDYIEAVAIANLAGRTFTDAHSRIVSSGFAVAADPAVGVIWPVVNYQFAGPIYNAGVAIPPGGVFGFRYNFLADVTRFARFAHSQFLGEFGSDAAVYLGRSFYYALLSDEARQFYTLFRHEEELDLPKNPKAKDDPATEGS